MRPDEAPDHPRFDDRDPIVRIALPKQMAALGEDLLPSMPRHTSLNFGWNEFDEASAARNNVVALCEQNSGHLFTDARHARSHRQASLQRQPRRNMRSALGELLTVRCKRMATVDENGVRRAMGDPLPNYFPVVVPEGDFLLANLAIRSRRRAPGRRGAAVTNLFSGLIRCTGCNATMMVENKCAARRTGRHFICSNAKRGAGCEHRRRWRVDTTEEAILGRLWDVDLTTVLDPPKPGASAHELEALRATLEDAQVRQDRLLDLVEAGDDRATVRARALPTTIKDLKARLAKAEGEKRVAEHAPTARDRLAAVRELSRQIRTAQGEGLVELRTPPSRKPFGWPWR